MTWPDVGDRCPSSTSSVVVLPAPLVPSSAYSLAASDRETEAPHGDVRAFADPRFGLIGEAHVPCLDDRLLCRFPHAFHDPDGDGIA